MANNPGDDFVNKMKDTFQKPIETAYDTMSKIGDAASSALGLSKNTPPKPSSTAPRPKASTWNDNRYPEQKLPTKPMPSHKDGTDYVDHTGPAVLHKGEAVLKKEDANKLREAKGKMANKSYDVSDELAGKKEEKPKKEIAHIKTRKAKSGGYVHTHVHTHPEHHPDEEHVSADQDAMASHMLQHLGEPNPGEAEADAGQSGMPAGAGAAVQPVTPTPTPGM